MAIAFRAASTNQSGSGASSLAITKPAGTANDDILLAFVVVSGDRTITAAPAGWTQLDAQATGSATGDCRHYVYWKRAASEGGSWTWTFSGTADCAGAVLAYSGALASGSPVNIYGVLFQSASTTSLSTAPVTPSVANAMAVYGFGVNPVYDGDLTFTTPSGLDPRAEADPGSPTTNRAVLKVFDQLLTDTSPVAAKTSSINDAGKALSFVVVLAPSGVSAQTAQVGPTRTSSGCMAGWWAASGYPGDFDNDETELGKTFPVVRLYHQPGDWGQAPYYSDDVEDAVNDGRLVLASYKSTKESNSWKRVATGDWDTYLQNLADALKAFDKEFVFIFGHEPHDDCSDIKGGSMGTSTDYRGAWKRIAQVFQDRGAVAPDGKVKLGYCAVGSWAMRGDPNGADDKCYPGDDIVDVICHDVYNWAGYHGQGWESFASEWDDIVDWAGRHDKPIIAGEIGSHPGSGSNTRDQWFRDAADWLESGTVTQGGRTTQVNKHFIGFCYFHSPPPKEDWTFLDATIPNQSSRFGQTQLAYAYGSGHDFGGPNPNYRKGKDGWIDAFVENSYFKGTPLEMAQPGQATPGIVALNLSGAGAILSKERFGVPSVALASGAISIFGAGAIAPGESDVYVYDVDSGAGVDPGGIDAAFSVAVTTTITGAGGIASGEMFGTPYREFGGSAFTPPSRYEYPLIIGHYRNAPTGRTVIKNANGTYSNVDVLTPELEASALRIYRGGYVYQVEAAEATLLARAGYTLGELPIGVAHVWAEVTGRTWGEAAGFTWGTL